MRARGALAWFVLGALGGCIRPDLVDCADGRTCPQGTACDLEHATCVDPADQAVCAGAAELAPCSSPGVMDGICDHGLCIHPGCGNGVVEPGELCDDGNQVGGDGCSAECTSRERCGDGALDMMRGEACDDGNLVNRDGCDSTCATEDLRWSSHQSFDLAPRPGAKIVYDPLRDRLVMFGGTSDHVFEWDGAAWLEYAPDLRPDARTGFAMAYDPVRRRTVIFGGVSPTTGVLGDTWAWDGVRWKRLHPIAAPPARLGAAMAWDSDMKRMVLFGGSQYTGEFYISMDETWFFDGTDWAPGPAAPTGGARSYAYVAYDAALHRVVLFGGIKQGVAMAQNLRDTWTFDGTAWTKLAIPDLAQDLAPIAYDAHRGVVTLIGTSAWDLEAAGWASHASSTFDNSNGSATFVARLGAVVVWGGATTQPLRVYDGTQVVGVPGSPFAGGHTRDGIASDPLRGRVVIFGVQDVAEWDGRAWTHIAATIPLRPYPAMVYDAKLHEVIAFGGFGPLANDPPLAELWSWNGTRWLDRTAAGPAARGGAAFAYDEARSVAMLYGGTTDHTDFLTDTWAWDGAAWTRKADGPAVRLPHLAYDARRDRSVLVGLSAAGSLETWEWDGSSWAQKITTSQPSGGVSAVIYNRARRRVVAITPAIESWEWDGATWRLIGAAGLAPPRRNSAMIAYDETHREVLLQGGTLMFPFADTWTASYIGNQEECASGVDTDGDGLKGCADLDCRPDCDPDCRETTATAPACVAARPHCGDGACDPLETDRMCPADCAVSTAVCGDAFCAPGESCSLDCP